MTVQEITAQLAKLYHDGKRYHFVERARHVLAQIDSAPDLALIMVRALAEMGLGGPAKEFRQSRSDLPSGGPAAAEVENLLCELPNGRISWRQYEDTFRKNLETMKPDRLELSELAKSSKDLLGKVHLYQTTQGQHLLSRREPGKLREWLGDLTTIEIEPGLEIPPQGKLGPTVIIGASYGPATERIYDDTHHLHLTSSYPLYWIEPDSVRFTAWLHCADHTKFLADARVRFFIGHDAVSQFEQLLDQRERLSLPTFILNCDSDDQATKAVSAVFDRVFAKRQSEFDTLQKELHDRYRDRDAAYWAKRFKKPGGAKSVWGITSRLTTMLQYSMRDILSALENEGFTTRMFIEQADDEFLPPGEWCREILEHDPDLIVCLDHLRHEYPFVPKNIPFLCWIQDPMPKLLCAQAGESIGPLDFVCGYFDNRCTTEFGYPPEQFEFTNIPISTTVFHDGEIDEQARTQYQCDICYVSNASTPIDRFFDSAIDKYPDVLRPLLHVIYSRVTEMLERGEHLDLQFDLPKLVPPLAARFNLTLHADHVEHIHTYFAYRLFDWGRRQQTLQWVADWARRTGRSFRIYGRGWEDHPRLAEFAAGVIQHGEPLRQAYRASRMALQLNPEGFRHQRALEILACGTLPLARYCPTDFDYLDIETYVTERDRGEHSEGIATVFPGLERIVFRSPEEFESLAEGFLADEAHYSEVISDLRCVVLRDYTYDAVMKRVLGQFRKHVVRQAELATSACIT